jgi:hypothetical protein
VRPPHHRPALPRRPARPWPDQVDGRLVTYWLLPDQELPAQVLGDNVVARYLAEVEKQFPPRTPLDEDVEDEE